MFKLFFALSLLAFPLSTRAGETACVYSLAGTVEIMKAGETAWQPADKGTPLAEGYKVRTGDKANCEIIFKDGTFLKLDAGTETAFDELKTAPEGRSFLFSLLRGKSLWMAAKIKTLKNKFSVRTPSAVCAVRGTDFSIVVSSSGETEAGLFEGKMAVSDNAQKEKEILAGSEASVASGGEVAVQARFSRLMEAEKRQYEKLKNRVENLRKRMEARDGFLDDYVNRQQKKMSDFDARRAEKLNKR
jgi:hypothetical protein